MAHSFDRVGNARRFVFQISNTKSQIEQSRPAGHAVQRANANRVRYDTYGAVTATEGTRRLTFPFSTFADRLRFAAVGTFTRRGFAEFYRKDGKMHGCRCLTAILFGFALTGCSPEVSEESVGSDQFSGGNTEEIAGGFVESGSAGGRGGFAGGGGFGGATPQWDKILEGEIDGDYVLLRSGSRIESYRGKGATPLVIKINSECLPLVPGTDEVGEQLLKLSGSRVKLRGRTWTTVALGRGSKGGQQGYRDAIPDHEVYFLIVDTVEAP